MSTIQMPQAYAEATIRVVKKRKRRKPRARKFVPDGCANCLALRPKGEQFTRVYVTKREGNRIIRYIKCDYCGHTFKQVEST